VKSFQTQTFYELLEVSVSAGESDIRFAFERLHRLYAEDQVALYGLIDDEMARALRERLNEAAATLLNDERRATYDAALGLPPRDVPRPHPRTPVMEPRSPAPAGWGGAYEFVSPPANAPPATSTSTSTSFSYTVAASATAIASIPSSSPTEAIGTHVRSPVSERLSVAEETERAGPNAEADASGRRPVEASRSGQPSEAEPAQAVASSAEPPALVSGAAPVITESESARQPTAPSAPEFSPEVISPAPGGATDGSVASEPSSKPLREPLKTADPVSPPEPSLPVRPAITRDRAHDEGPGSTLSESEEARAAAAGDAEGSGSAIVATRPPPRDYRPPERLKPYEVPAGVEFNGDLLRQVRMARGLSLSQLSERTRVGIRHLENLENDRYDQLPVAVYLRGMLMSLSRELGLDGLRVAKSYLTFVEAHLSKSKG
jgi:curved DNA-binding protein CbpA